MIISRWNGFEIDSSEGYYAFERDLKEREIARDFLRKLVNSPLTWEKVSFTLLPFQNYKNEVENYLLKQLKNNKIEKFKHDFPDELEREKVNYDFKDYIDDHLPPHIMPEYICSRDSFLEIFEDSKNFLNLLSLNFCIKPLRKLPENEYKKLREWFLNQFNKKKRGKTIWEYLCEIDSKQFELSGVNYLNSCPEDSDPFEGNLEIYSEFFAKKSCSFRFNASAINPSLMIYLLFQVIDSFYLKFRGNHYMFDDSPDKIKQLKDGSYLSEEATKLIKPDHKK